MYDLFHFKEVQTQQFLLLLLLLLFGEIYMPKMVDKLNENYLQCEQKQNIYLPLGWGKEKPKKKKERKKCSLKRKTK